jgi:hypothetical protein
VDAIYKEYNRLISFVSVHHALRAEKVLAAEGILAVALPTPREISVSCGQCVLLKDTDIENVLEVFRRENVEWSKLFTRDVAHKIYEKIADFEVQHG